MTRAEGRDLARSLINTVAVYTEDYPGLSGGQAKREAVAALFLAGDPDLCLRATIVVVGRFVRELADVYGVITDEIIERMRDWLDFDLRDDAG